jgi:hypothetical protein
MRCSSGCCRLLASLLFALAACGRVGFEGSGDGSLGDGAGDSRASDAQLGAWPNMPAGCNVLTDVELDVVPAAGWGVMNNVTTVADVDAPSGNAFVSRVVFPMGFTGGTSPGFLYYDTIPTSANEVFFGLVWRASNPWDGHQSGFNSIFYIQANDGTNTMLMSMTMAGTDEPYRLRAEVETVILNDNISQPAITVGVWHTIEFRVRLSSSPAVMDGIVLWWLDGVLVGEQPIATDSVRFDAWNLQPIWGGVGDAKATTDDVRMDRAMVCVP